MPSPTIDAPRANERTGTPFAMKSLDRTARASRPEYDVHLTENVMVSMRAGARLATDIYRPARAGQPLTDRPPVPLHRTPSPDPTPRADAHPARSKRLT